MLFDATPDDGSRLGAPWALGALEPTRGFPSACFRRGLVEVPSDTAFAAPVRKPAASAISEMQAHKSLAVVLYRLAAERRPLAPRHICGACSSDDGAHIVQPSRRDRLSPWPEQTSTYPRHAGIKSRHSNSTASVCAAPLRLGRGVPLPCVAGSWRRNCSACCAAFGSPHLPAGALHAESAPRVLCRRRRGLWGCFKSHGAGSAAASRRRGRHTATGLWAAWG